MNLTKEDRNSLASAINGATFYETERVINGSAFTESGLTPTGQSKAERAKKVREKAAERLALMHIRLRPAKADEHMCESVVNQCIKQLDEFIAAHTPLEQG